MLMSQFKMEVIDIIDNEDGGAKVTLEMDDEARNFIKKHYGWKRWSTKKFQILFTEMLTKYVEVHGKDKINI